VPGRPSPVVCIGTAHIRTTVVEPRCEHTNDFDFLSQRSHYRRFQTLLCVYAPCLYAQRCLSLVVITQNVPKGSQKKPSQQGPDPAVCIRTVPIRTAVFEPCCDCTNSSQKVRKRSHHSGGQTLLCVYAPCLYAQRCLRLVVITQMLPKKF
jgi:hypothetical protein